jgi:hypothetical protein
MLSLSSYVYWPFVLLLRIVCSVHLSFYSEGCWFCEKLVFWALCIFWLLIPCQMNSWQRFFPHSVDCLFSLVTVSFFVQKLFSFMQFHLSILSLYCWAIHEVITFAYVVQCVPYFSWINFTVSDLTLNKPGHLVHSVMQFNLSRPLKNHWIS